MRIDPGTHLPQEVEAAIIRISKRGETAQVKYDERVGKYKVHSLKYKLECEEMVCVASGKREKSRIETSDLSTLAKSVLKGEKILPKEY
jgi:hypothetical protein